MKCAECEQEFIPNNGTGADIYCPNCNWESYGPCGWCENGTYIGPKGGMYGVCNCCGGA